MTPEAYEKLPTYPLVPLPEGFEDARGVITNVALDPEQWVTSVAVLTSKKGSVRANHLHRTDAHLSYLVSGAMKYYWQPCSSITPGYPPLEGVRVVDIAPGQAFYSPPSVRHAMLFTEDSVLLTLAPKVRSHAEHEADLVRVPSLVPEADLAAAQP